MKKAIWAVVLAGLGVGSYFLFFRKTDAGGPKQQIKKVQAKVQTLRLSVNAPGEVRPKRLVELKCKASGQVTAFKKRPGDRVSANEIIATLDPEPEKRNVRREQANHDSALARLRLLKLESLRAWAQGLSELQSAQADYEAKAAIAKSMREVREGYSETERKTAEANESMAKEKVSQTRAALLLAVNRYQDDQALAQAEVDRARAALEDAQDRLKDTEIRSPIDGILLDKKVEEGQIVSSGISSASGGTTVAMVADISSYVIVANVDDTDVGKLREDLPAFVTLQGLQDKRFDGTVKLVPPQGVNESNIIVFKVEIEVPGGQFPRPYIGMTATAEIVIEERKDALVVPSAAVKSEKGKKHVLGPDQQPIAVTTGLDNGEFTEILTGLKPDQELVIVYTVSESTGGGRPYRMR